MNDDKTSNAPSRVRNYSIVFREPLSSLTFVLLSSLWFTGCGGQPTDSAAISDASGQGASEMSDSEPTASEVGGAKSLPKAKPIVLEELPDPAGDGGHFSISQIMALAHETKLYKELLKDEFDPAVAKRLLLLYNDLPTQSSPGGSDEDWEERSPKLAEAVQLIMAEDPSGKVALKKAVNCNSCHSRHRS